MPSFGKWLVAISCALFIADACAGVLSIGDARIEADGSASASLKDGALFLKMDNPSGDSAVHLRPPAGQTYWDLSDGRILAVDVENLSAVRQLRLNLRIKSASKNKRGAFQEEVGGIALNPGERRTLRMKVPHQWLYSMPEGVPGPKAMDTKSMTSIDFYLQWPFEKASPGLVDCKVSALRLEEPLTPSPDASPAFSSNFFPFIDAFGQYAHADWPEKIHSAADLKANYEREKATLASSKRPEEWDRFGGWRNGPQLEATGYFRTGKFQGKWYLVDPEGRLFISHGMDVLIAHTDAIKTTGHEKWFSITPPSSGVWQPVDQNLKLKYGKAGYLPEFYSTLAKRLESWGFNTVGDWGSSSIMELGLTPYTLQLTDYDAKMPRLGKMKFYDVFDPAYIDKMRNLVDLASKRDPIVQKSLTDPMCIGYFIDNELNFGERSHLPYLNEIMRGPATMPSKLKFAEFLKDRYESIEGLNGSWLTSYKDWEALLASPEVPSGSAYLRDATAFFPVVLEQYFMLCRDAVKSVAPHRLYLGCRFIGTDAARPALYTACAKYADVLSVNIYAHTPANFPSVDFPDIPVIIGEFHFGVGGRGMFSPTLCIAGVTEAERAAAYTRFMQGALVHPNIVGAHWFQMRDQPLTGRWDGEGHQLGFVDVADTPYDEMIAASRKVGESMYRYRMNGRLQNSMETGR